MVVKTIQLGKLGITDNFIESLKNQFKKSRTVKVSVLRSANREDIEKYQEELLDKMGKNFTARKIGFTIILKKWRKERNK